MLYSLLWGDGELVFGQSKIVRKASSVVEIELDGVAAEMRMSGKLKAIRHDLFYPLCTELRQLRFTFSHTFIQPHVPFLCFFCSCYTIQQYPVLQ